MPKSVEELFSGSSFDTPKPDEAPQVDAPEEGAQPASEQRTAAEAELPAPQAQSEDGDKPTAVASQAQGAPPAPEETDGRDPAYGRLRKERNDFRGQAEAEKIERARAEERLAASERRARELEAQLQRVQQPQQQPRQQQQQIPNPVEDPAGYANFVLEASRRQAEMAEQRALFLSEANAKRTYGNEVVKEAFAWFENEVREKPQHQEILAEADPWDALVVRYQKAKALAEIGDDPVAYKARVEAEQRAKWEAEYRAQAAEQAQQQPISPRQTVDPKNLPPSLGRVPNAGSRSGPARTGPAPIEALWGS